MEKDRARIYRTRMMHGHEMSETNLRSCSKRFAETQMCAIHTGLFFWSCNWHTYYKLLYTVSHWLVCILASFTSLSFVLKSRAQNQNKLPLWIFRSKTWTGTTITETGVRINNAASPPNSYKQSCKTAFLPPPSCGFVIRYRGLINSTLTAIQ